MIRLATIVGLGLFAILVGAGCKNLKEIDISLTGFEAEYYPAHPDQESGGFFGAVTNVVHAMPASYPQLMPMTGKR
tara:strand:+ start:506 stop:733 length:228 start_codon:yes stop_codon:yes gene_type:complete